MEPKSRRRCVELVETDAMIVTTQNAWYDNPEGGVLSLSKQMIQPYHLFGLRHRISQGARDSTFDKTAICDRARYITTEIHPRVLKRQFSPRQVNGPV